jgi:hypothetical protein
MPLKIRASEAMQNI